jgi:hypothetical protein
MKIEIDTKKDSKEDIAKIIKMLQTMIGESTNYVSAYEDKSAAPQDMSAGFGFLDGPDSSNSSSTDKTSNTEEKKEIPRVEFF